MIEFSEVFKLINCDPEHGSTGATKWTPHISSDSNQLRCPPVHVPLGVKSVNMEQQSYRNCMLYIDLCCWSFAGPEPDSLKEKQESVLLSHCW